MHWREATPLRRVAWALAFAALTAASPRLARGEDAAPAADAAAMRAPVERIYGALSALLPQAPQLGYAGRYARLEPVIKGAYQLPFMAAKTLGRHWDSLSEADRTRYVDVFSRLTVATFADRFDRFAEQRFEVLGVEPAAQGTTLVRTRIVTGKDEPVHLDYRVRKGDDGWRIIDVFLNGTVSELAVRRSEYSGIVQRDGLDALIAALEQKIVNAEKDPPSP